MRDTSYNIIVDSQHDGSRLDAFLSGFLDDISRSYIVKLIQDGNLYINGKSCIVKKTKISAGDEILLMLPEPKLLEVKAENLNLDIVYEDVHLMVVNKPKGMVVHPAPGNESGTLVNGLMYISDSLSNINGIIRPGIVHRIDKNTSGLLVVAKDDVTHRELAKQLSEHKMKREYRAVVNGSLKKSEGTIDEPIGRDPKNRIRMAVTYENSKDAVTHYKVIENMGNYSYIEAKLETGRTHQIRVHMAYIRHPLLGDEVYGKGKNPFGITGQVLHAKTLGFVHPATKKYVEFDSELPCEFEKVLTCVRKKQG